MLDDPRGEEGKRDAHVFVSVEGDREVEVLYVEAYVSSPRCADHAVPQELGNCDVGCSRGEFARVINEIPICHDTDTVGIIFLEAVVDDYLCVRGGPVLGNIWNVGGEHDEHDVCALLSRLVVALTHASEILPESRHPGLCCCQVLHETLVAADGFASEMGWIMGIARCLLST